ncbi:MAG TPA: PAS domain-containing protein [Thermomicrobiales bacterium]|nr:PAS domain-containing protein [Thermomicrobiales bacterium]
MSRGPSLASMRPWFGASSPASRTARSTSSTAITDTCWRRGLAVEGQDAELLVGRRLVDVFGTHRVALVDPPFRRAFAGEEVVFDHVMGPRTYEIRASPLDYDGDAVATIATVASDVTATLAAVAGLVVPRLADWCAIHLVGDDGEIERIALTHGDPSKEALARELVEGYRFKRDAAAGTARVRRTGESELVPRIPDEMLVAAVDALPAR